MAAGNQAAALPCQEEDHQAWHWDSPLEAEQQGHHIRPRSVEVEEADPHLKEREVATGCTVEGACQAGFEVAGQSHRGLEGWDDEEGHRFGNRRVLQVVARNPVLQAGSCRMVFAVRWEEGGRQHRRLCS